LPCGLCVTGPSQAHGKDSKGQVLCRALCPQGGMANSLLDQDKEVTFTAQLALNPATGPHRFPRM
jgi:hypothetical protein